MTYYFEIETNIDEISVLIDLIVISESNLTYDQYMFHVIQTNLFDFNIV